MTKKAGKKSKRPIFEGIRKPTAPSSQRFGSERPDARTHPALRKVKHKKKRDEPQMNDDVQ